MAQAVPLLSGLSAVSLVVLVTLVGVNASGGGDLGTSSDSKNRANHVMSAEDSASSPAALEASQYPPVGTSVPPLHSGPGNTTNEFGGEDIGAAEATRVAAVDSAPATISGNTGDDGDSDTAVHIAEAVAAALALGSGGLAFAAYRRTR